MKFRPGKIIGVALIALGVVLVNRIRGGDWPPAFSKYVDGVGVPGTEIPWYVKWGVYAATGASFWFGLKLVTNP